MRDLFGHMFTSKNVCLNFSSKISTGWKKKSFFWTVCVWRKRLKVNVPLIVTCQATQNMFFAIDSLQQPAPEPPILEKDTRNVEGEPITAIKVISVKREISIYVGIKSQTLNKKQENKIWIQEQSLNTKCFETFPSGHLRAAAPSTTPHPHRPLDPNRLQWPPRVFNDGSLECERNWLSLLSREKIEKFSKFLGKSSNHHNISSSLAQVYKYTQTQLLVGFPLVFCKVNATSSKTTTLVNTLQIAHANAEQFEALKKQF